MLYFLLYDDNSHNIFLENLITSIHKYSTQYKIILYHKNDIDPEFVEKCNHILSLKRGGGYWLWKPYIINKLLTKINNDDVIFYLDSKYYFTEKFECLYLEHMKNNDLLIWKNKPNESNNYMKNWCKMDVILKYDMFNKIFIDNAEDCWAGSIVIKKTDFAVKLMNEWFDMCCIYENITDSPSIAINSVLFNEHRHDQSLLSIIVHKYNIKMLYFEKKYLQNVRCPYY